MSARDVQNRYRRKRYANDPEYRQRVLEQQRARLAARAKYKRERYRHDPEYRAAEIERARRYRDRTSAISTVGFARRSEDYVNNGQYAVHQLGHREFSIVHGINLYHWAVAEWDKSEKAERERANPPHWKQYA